MRDMQIPDKLTPEDAEAKLRQIDEDFGTSDQEVSHILADEVLLAVLRFHGHDVIADLFDALPKWYA